jgi:multidrug efflux pump subunit AcrA (membrane-fusion protein)
MIGLLLILPACSRDSEEAVSPKEQEEEAALPTNRIAIPATVRGNLGITFAKVERRNVANTVRVPGSFELQPLAKHEYRTMLPSHIEFLVNQFDTVEEGTPLYKFRSLKLLELQQAVDLAKADLALTQAKYDTAKARIVALAKANVKRAELDAQVAELQADIDQRQVQLRVATSAYEQAAQTSMGENEKPAAGDWVEVLAKEAGVVESLAVTNGTYVEETSLILTIVDPTKVRFHAMGLQSDLATFKNGQAVSIVPPQARKNDLNESIKATLQIGLKANPQQRTIDLFAILGTDENKSWSRPGVSAFLEVAEQSSDGIVLAIPSSAVVKDGITHVFFKRDPLDPNKAIRVEADMGVNDGRWTEIKSELGPKDEVVLNGAYELKLASSQSGTSQKGGHFHGDGTFHAEED